MTARVLLLSLLLTTPLAAQPDDLVLLLLQRNGPDCRLVDVDLVHADLRDADLSGAQLQRTNLSQARLDGANLRNTDLRLTSLKGASLRGADLRGSRMYGTDLRQANLDGAQLDDGALEQAYWQGARGVSNGVRSHAALHNAGVMAAENGRWKRAEALFSAAINAEQDKPLSWVARGIARGELGDFAKASNDMAYAGELFADRGDAIKAKQLKLASQNVYAPNPEQNNEGNGIGSVILSSSLSAFRALAPIALRTISF